MTVVIRYCHFFFNLQRKYQDATSKSMLRAQVVKICFFSCVCVCVYVFASTELSSRRLIAVRLQMLVRAPSAVLSSSRCFGDSPNYARAGNVTTAAHRFVPFLIEIYFCVKHHLCLYALEKSNFNLPRIHMTSSTWKGMKHCTQMVSKREIFGFSSRGYKQ